MNIHGGFHFGHDERNKCFISYWLAEIFGKQKYKHREFLFTAKIIKKDW